MRRITKSLSRTERVPMVTGIVDDMFCQCGARRLLNTQFWGVNPELLMHLTSPKMMSVLNRASSWNA